jgi:uncharacterized protein
MPKDPVCGMDVDESTGLKLTSGNETHYFCSKHCMEKFAKEKGLEKEAALCLACAPQRKAWYRNRVFIVALILLFISGLSYFVPLLVPFRESLWMYARTVWWAVLLGLLIGGVIERFIPGEYISMVLSRPHRRTILYSVFFGFFMSVCSHGILALSMQLYKKGASVPAVVSFLLASPWANLPLTILMVGLFGLKAFFIIMGAVVIAITTGFIFQYLEKKNLIETNRNTVKVDAGFSIWADMKKRAGEYKPGAKQFREDLKTIIGGTVSLADMVLWWILIGIGLASLFGAYIPQHIFHKYMGPTFLGMLVTLALATIIEVCSEGTAPLAFEIYRQTGALGNSFVFLMAGVVTDYTEIGLIWTNIGRKAAIWLPIVTVPQVIILGVIANMIF